MNSVCPYDNRIGYLLRWKTSKAKLFTISASSAYALKHRIIRSSQYVGSNANRGYFKSKILLLRGRIFILPFFSCTISLCFWSAGIRAFPALKSLTRHHVLADQESCFFNFFFLFFLFFCWLVFLLFFIMFFFFFFFLDLFVSFFSFLVVFFFFFFSF